MYNLSKMLINIDQKTIYRLPNEQVNLFKKHCINLKLTFLFRSFHKLTISFLNKTKQKDTNRLILRVLKKK